MQPPCRPAMPALHWRRSAAYSVPILLAARFWLRYRRSNGRCRNIGNRLLQGSKLLGHRGDLLGQPLCLRLLSGELVLNDLQVVDSLLLCHLETLQQITIQKQSRSATRNVRITTPASDVRRSSWLWIQWTTTIATKPRPWGHVLPSTENEKPIEDSHDLAFLVATFGRLRCRC
jgi:hypothetical protein